MHLEKLGIPVLGGRHQRETMDGIDVKDIGGAATAHAVT